MSFIHFCENRINVIFLTRKYVATLQPWAIDYICCENVLPNINYLSTKLFCHRKWAFEAKRLIHFQSNNHCTRCCVFFYFFFLPLFGEERANNIDSMAQRSNVNWTPHTHGKFSCAYDINFCFAMYIHRQHRNKFRFVVATWIPWRWNIVGLWLCVRAALRHCIWFVIGRIV